MDRPQKIRVAIVQVPVLTVYALSHRYTPDGRNEKKNQLHQNQ